MGFKSYMEGKKIILKDLEYCKKHTDNVFITDEMEKFFNDKEVTIDVFDTADNTFTIKEDEQYFVDKWWFDANWIKREQVGE